MTGKKRIIVPLPSAETLAASQAEQARHVSRIHVERETMAKQKAKKTGGRRSKPLLLQAEREVITSTDPEREPGLQAILGEAPFDAWCIQHPVYLKAPSDLKDPVFIGEHAVPGADELPEPIELLLASLRLFSVPTFHDGVPVRARVARLMGGHGLTKIAGLLGIQKSRFSKWERSAGRAKPGKRPIKAGETRTEGGSTLTRAKLSTLAALLDIDEEWLLSADGTKIPQFLQPWHTYMESENRRIEARFRNAEF